MTANPDFKVMPSFDTAYFRNGIDTDIVAMEY